MVDWFVGPIMEKIINAGFQYLHDQVRWQTGMKEELERLQEKHPKIQAVIFAASQAQFTDQNPALNKWLWQLRDVIDEAEDVLDDIEYVKHEQQLAKNKKKTKVRSTVCSMTKKFVKIGKRALKIDPNLKRLEEVVKKLDKVSADVGNFLHLLESTKQEQQEQQLDLYKSRETGSLPKNNLIGRGKHMEFVMQWLRQPSDEEHQTPIAPTNLYSNISLLSIVGHGGMGKTTLLQHVYEHEMTEKFDLKMWVCVSNNSDAKKIIADILERPCLESINTLQKDLKSKVQSKKFLLVLDDIWDDDKGRDKNKWENVLAPLAYGSLGSKILLTTRMDSVADMIATVVSEKTVTLKLNGLKEDECLQLLNTHAFANVENPDNYKKLNSITTEMVKKLSGSPLAAKVIGGVLNDSLDEKFWITILNSDFGSKEFGQNGILPILRLSYMFLPIYLRSCFAYCCIFRQDTKLYKDELVQKWIAVGFIQQHSNSRETIVDMGRRYFDILVRKSFFEKFQINNFTYYKMHDLLHELAQTVFAQECFRFEGHEELLSRVPKSIRHLSIYTANLEVLKNLTKFKKLHSLHMAYNSDGQDFVVELAEIFKASRSLRLLHINSGFLIPEEIGYLIHLRYLNIRGTSIRLPKSLSKLYHLQFFFFSTSIYSLSNNFLPKDFNNLSNLHYLQLPMDKFSEIHDIGKLISLENIEDFRVMNEDGHRIGELEHMNNLRSLNIKSLRDLNDATEACNAKLCDKRNLTDLSLDWAGSGQNIVDPDLDERVLDTLQPHDNLKNLEIIDYMGFRSAIWMNAAHSISNLEQIILKRCLEWQTLPPFWQLPSLKFLYLEDMPKVKRIENDKDCGFPSLKVLHIEKLEALEDWFDAAAAADYCLFPCLTKLFLKDCPYLQELPYLPPKLEIVEMDNIGWKTLSCCSISKSIPLDTLFVVGCPKIAYIPLADEIARFEALRNLKILDCPNLISLGGRQEVVTTENCQLQLSHISINDPSLLLMEPLRSNTSLEKLVIKYNNDLVSFPIEAEQWFLQYRSSLHNLTIKRLNSLQSLPSSLENLSSLKILCLRDVPQLQLLPNIPTSLVHLELANLESLQCLPSSLPTISNLHGLCLVAIPLLKSLPNLPPSLRRLRIEKCQLADLSGSLENLSSLSDLRLIDVPQLQLLPNIPTSLVCLELTNLESLQCLPSSLPTFSQLYQLTLKAIPLLKSLPNLPPSLTWLSIYECHHPELADRYNKLSGSDYHKIAHIPRLDIHL